MPVSSENDPLAHMVKKLGYDVFRGSENDVLGRYWSPLFQSKVDRYRIHEFSSPYTLRFF